MPESVEQYGTESRSERTVEQFPALSAFDQERLSTINEQSEKLLTQLATDTTLTREARSDLAGQIRDLAAQANAILHGQQQTLQTLIEQRDSIVEEWSRDLAAGITNASALDLYFARRVDQYNAMVEQAAISNPAVREGASLRIDFPMLKASLGQVQTQHEEFSIGVNR
jgi:uncharacterized phage infection (PIP) family protein YhgE